MLFSKIISYIRGFVIIIIEGLFPERFINICTRNKIPLTDIQRKDKTHISAKMNIPDFRRLRGLKSKSKCKIHIESKYGLPFFLYKHKKRKPLVLGLLIFCAVLCLMTRFVWIIEITGNEKLKPEEIIAKAEKAGLYAGMPVKSLDSSSIQSYLMTNMNELKFVSVNRTGVVVNIDVREREEIRKHFDASTPTNIIATENGVIEEILVQSGTAVVSKGDVVYKGQLLVSGANDNKATGIKFSRSDAQIKARVWHEETVNTPFYNTKKTETGNVKKAKKLKIFGFSLNLFIKNKILFEKYDILSYTKYISLGEGKIIPIGIETTEYKEYTEKRVKLSGKELEKYLTDKMDKKLKGTEIVSRNFKSAGGKVTAVYECIEDIVKEEKFNDDRQIP